MIIAATTTSAGGPAYNSVHERAKSGGLTISPKIAPQVIIPPILVVLSPLALLSAFVLRSATVTRRTASIGPMVPDKEVGEGTVASTDVTEH